MPKVKKIDNMTLISEEPAKVIADISGSEPVEDQQSGITTLGMAQNAALAQFDEKQEERKEPELRELVNLEKKVIEYMQYLGKRRIVPNFANVGSITTCTLIDATGNNIMPVNNLTGKPKTIWGDDKDRALINAVNAYKELANNGSQIKPNQEAPKNGEGQLAITVANSPDPVVSDSGNDFTDKERHLVLALRMLIQDAIQDAHPGITKIKREIINLVKELEKL